MSRPRHFEIRKLLHQYHDGLTAMELSERLQLLHDSTYNALRNMPDTYIDRWTKAKQGQPSQAVWCVVVPPEDCPKPRPKKSNARPTELRRVEPRNLSQICAGGVSAPTGTARCFGTATGRPEGRYAVSTGEYPPCQ